ncbi:MAG: cadmium-translocating P-type ATPase [Ignavibacteriales bacterium]|nr:cadmium-translocating P-type ATPase [Ignavibacteriales bacterium]
MNSAIQETTITIHDLCCATEEQTIRRKLEKHPGIKNLDFNIVSHKLKVQHTCNETIILQQLKDIGLPGFIESSSAQHSQHNTSRQLLLSTGISAALLLAGIAAAVFHFPEIFSRTLFLCAMVAGGWHIALKAHKSVKNFSLDMNFLMAIASIGAIIVGQYAEGAAVIVLFAFSLVLESRSMERTRRAIHSMMRLSPTSVTVIRNGKEVIVPVEQIAVDEIIIIRPGERIGLDGTVLTGHSNVDQAPITGESIPVPKKRGGTVYAGSFNQQGSLEIRVTKPAIDSTLARIIHLVEEAQSKKAPSQTFVEQFARYYTPSVFALAIVVATIPPLVFHATFGEWFYRALVLLVIACPCALVISTPISIVSALTNAARQGILFKGGKHLEKLSQVHAIAFDKTGTLTEGRPTVTDIISLDSMSPHEILRITATAELKSEHHLADAFLRKAQEEKIPVESVNGAHFSSIAGKGIRATVDGSSYIIGNHQLIEEMGVCSPKVEQTLSALEEQGKTVVILSNETQALGVIAIADRVREESIKTVEKLHTLGIEKVILLTGDNRGTAVSVAKQLRVDEVKAELLPHDKLNEIQKLKATHGSVAMVGDGINDAPALAAANVGIVMGGIGSDTAMETADVVLMSDNISKIPHGIMLGKKTVGIIKQNIALALLTKTVFIVLGIFGWTSLWLAILADDGATLLVILNSLRLLKTK